MCSVVKNRRSEICLEISVSAVGDDASGAAGARRYSSVVTQCHALSRLPPGGCGCAAACAPPARAARGGKHSTAEPPEQSGQARGGAHTMRWLWAALLCVAVALSPPRFRPVLLTPRWHAIAPAADQSGVFLLHVHRWLVELKENTAIRAPHHHDCRFYRGRVVREAGSSAAVTECAGRLYGLLQVGGDEFLLQPAQSVRYTHALRRRAAPALDVALTEYAPAFNLTDDMITDFDVDVTDYDDSTTDRFPSVRTRQADRDAAYFHDIAPVTRPLSAAHGLWLELAIVADHTMIDFHGRERMNHYILALMNIVSAIFNDPSLNSNMTLVIKKLFHYEKDNTIKSGNAKKSLESINKWNHRNLRKLPPESRWDAAVWLTRAELGGPSGLAPLGGVCSTPRSAALDRDEGLTSAFVIAHELAHLSLKICKTYPQINLESLLSKGLYYEKGIIQFVDPTWLKKSHKKAARLGKTHRHRVQNSAMHKDERQSPVTLHVHVRHICGCRTGACTSHYSNADIGALLSGLQHFIKARPTSYVDIFFREQKQQHPVQLNWMFLLLWTQFGWCNLTFFRTGNEGDFVKLMSSTSAFGLAPPLWRDFDDYT
ncbi:A disintegrin and metalloproteinase with thrombospondin motifs 3 [Eumeta japonica]|uniref:A disintegrin and metalloproteinase with thrombospondin motifs 3 n=1 Tax=Eumeta variegata TaxID=151549 RepID=A0A4C1T6Y2_EUMVA|nr:A disintegrin and metalloproteinase with thrombospondin motifs 3 [Eumeta japonica]